MVFQKRRRRLPSRWISVFVVLVSVSSPQLTQAKAPLLSSSAIAIQSNALSPYTRWALSPIEHLTLAGYGSTRIPFFHPVTLDRRPADQVENAVAESPVLPPSLVPYLSIISPFLSPETVRIEAYETSFEMVGVRLKVGPESAGVVAFGQHLADGHTTLLTIVSLDPHNKRQGFVELSKSKWGRWGTSPKKPFVLQDALTGFRYFFSLRQKEIPGNIVGRALYFDLPPGQAHQFILRSDQSTNVSLPIAYYLRPEADVHLPTLLRSEDAKRLFDDVLWKTESYRRSKVEDVYDERYHSGSFSNIPLLFHQKNQVGIWIDQSDKSARLAIKKWHLALRQSPAKPDQWQALLGLANDLRQELRSIRQERDTQISRAIDLDDRFLSPFQRKKVHQILSGQDHLLDQAIDQWVACLEREYVVGHNKDRLDQVANRTLLDSILSALRWGPARLVPHPQTSPLNTHLAKSA